MEGSAAKEVNATLDSERNKPSDRTELHKTVRTRLANLIGGVKTELLLTYSLFQTRQSLFHLGLQTSDICYLVRLLI